MPRVQLFIYADVMECIHGLTHSRWLRFICERCHFISANFNCDHTVKLNETVDAAVGFVRPSLREMPYMAHLYGENEMLHLLCLCGCLCLFKRLNHLTTQ